MKFTSMRAMLFVFCCVAVPFTATCQISLNGKPYSFFLGKNPKGKVQKLASTSKELRALNNEEELKRVEKIEENCVSCGREFYGTGIDVTIDVKKDGTRTEVENGKIWRVTITSQTALGMQFYFDKYKLPKHASLFIYNEDFSEILGAFTHINNHVDEKFATEIIDGRNITIEYFESYDAEFSGQLEIYKVIHVFKNSAKNDDKAGRFGDAAPCTIDVTCPDGNPYRNEKKAVCRISTYDASLELSAWCSGFLVNNTNFVRKPYVLTANHCIGNSLGQTRYHESIFEFGYEKDCGSSMEPFPHSVQGATLITTSGEQADNALLDLEVLNLESHVNVTYLGWDIREGITYPGTVGISHPSGDVKKIAISNASPVKTFANYTTTGEDINGFPKTHWRVSWHKGITWHLSSGSPLIDQGSKLAIGILAGGSSSCTNSGPDFYSRLAHGWNIYNNDAWFWPIGHYLDPDGTTQILASYVPFPESQDPNDPGGGGSNQGGISTPTDKGVALEPTYMLGDFTGGVNSEKMCNGDYDWKISHGSSSYQLGYFFRLYNDYDEGRGRQNYRTAITRTFPLTAGKEYVISLEVGNGYNVKELQVFIGNDVPIYGCSSLTSVSFPQRQQIMTIPIERFKDSSDDGKWYTFAARFVPNNNTTSIYIRHIENSIYDSQMFIDRIGIHEKGDFDNPQQYDNVEVVESPPSIVMANRTIAARQMQPTEAPIVYANSNSTFIAKKILLKPGFEVKRGGIFTAKVDDAIYARQIYNPFGALDFDVVSTLRSAEEDDTVVFTTNYERHPNLYANRDLERGLDGRSAISVIPSPAKQSFRIAGIVEQQYDVVIRDINGNMVYNQRVDQDTREVSVQPLPSGLYIAEVKSEAGKYFTKLVVEK